MSRYKPFLHQEAWSTTFDGWNIVDCAIRTRDIICLVLRKVLPQEEASKLRDFDIPTRLATLYLSAEEAAERWSHQGVEGFAQPRCGAARTPVAQGMAVGINGDILAIGSGRMDMEHMVEDGQPIAVRKLRCIEGRAYAVGLGREVFRRDGVDKWTRLNAGIGTIPKEQLGPDAGFYDIDGFSEQDMYAVGGAGDVWHYDGNSWFCCDFATNWPLFTVCCAGDGNVYISGEGGRIYRGRKDVWHQIWDAEYVVPYNDTLWFEDKLWLSSDYLFHQLINDEAKNVEHNGGRVLLRGHMDVADGVMVVADLDGVQLFDGKSWRVLVAPY